MAQHREAEARPSEVAHLRELLMGPEYAELLHTVQRVADTDERTELVAEVIADAVRQSTAKSDGLGVALAPTVSEAVRSSVENDPRPLVEALFPIIGPAIRRSVAEMVNSILAKVNTSIDHSFSPRSLRWRLEAKRTGVPFSEIVLRETLEYRVEQVFLVECETGLLLAHAAIDSEFRDPDLISGMLTAIRQFMTDSFGGEGSEVRSMDVGELSLIVEPGPRAVVAGLVRGTVSRDVKRSLKELVERLHLQFSQELKAFEGDASAFENAIPQLENCLVERALGADADETDGPAARRWIWWSLGALAVLGIVALGTLRWQRSQNFELAMAELRATPGIVVISADRDGDQAHLEILRDRDAPTPVEIAERAARGQLDFHVSETPHLSLDPKILLARAERQLDPPLGVELAIERDRVQVQGSADARWIGNARQVPPVLGTTGFEWQALEPDFGPMASELEGEIITFASGVSRLKPRQAIDLDRIAEKLTALATLALDFDTPLLIQIRGRSDDQGNPAFNRTIETRRANAVLDALTARGISADLVAIEDSEEPAHTASRETHPRRVEFQVLVGSQAPVEAKP